MSTSVNRLFKSFEPTHYDLTLVPDRDALTFSGKVTITGKHVGRPNQRLTFHQKGLNVTSATVSHTDKKGRREITVDRINTQKKFDELRLHTTEKLFPGTYDVTLEFTGVITESMQGMYPSRFKHDGKDKLIIATQFESHHAREVFPCIDEPEAKATFDLTLTVPKGEVALSNMPPKKKTISGDAEVYVFETTPKMSTYLLAFAYGEMHGVERKTKDGIVVRSWSSVGQPKDYVTFSAEEGVRVLEFFTEYFGVEYPLSKVDQIALPDFDAGAMENWGMITYREIALLSDPKNPSVSNEQYIAMVVAHELSHQWFGNLVTMTWWDELWLNESFASLMEHIALDAIHPEWQQWEHYASSDVISTTSRDVYSDIQPVNVEVTDPQLIHTLFDPGIVYAKGGRLLKMMREYIGDEAFRKGLTAYFKKHAYANATREDLWNAMSKASGKDVSRLMTPWLLQPGMPVLTATQKGHELVVQQSRFLLDGDADGKLWPVPLLSNKKVEPEEFDTETMTASLVSDAYVVLNEHASGHYFVRYTEDGHRRALADAIKEGTIAAESRINLINDVYMLSRRGDISLVDGLDMVVDNQAEPRDTVWGLMIRLVGAAAQLTERDEVAEKQLQQLRAHMAAENHAKLGWDDQPDDDANTKQLRHTMAAMMVGAHDAKTLETATKMYEKAKTLQEVDAEMRSTILIAAARKGGKKVVDALLDAYDDESAEVQMDITSAVTSLRDPVLSKHVLDRALGPKGFVRAQDVMRWMAMMLRNHFSRDDAWHLMVTEWDWLKNMLENSKSFDFLPVYAAGTVTTAKEAKRFKDFFEPQRKHKALERNIDVGLADIAARVAWRDRDEKPVKAWLDGRFPAAGTKKP